MRIAWALVVCLGCRQLLGIDDPVTDTTVDARLPPADAPAPVCQAAGPAMASGQFLGGSAGAPGASLACPNGQLPIGMGFATTAAAVDEGGGERVVTGVGVQCATITELADGDLAITPTILEEVAAPMMCSGYTPSTIAPVVNCPPNTVLVGLVGNGGKMSLFNTVAIMCAPLGPFGGPQVSVPVTDTGSFSNNPQMAQCEQSLVVTGFEILSGCGIDELALDCAQVGCQ